jgi:hypothetical protein
MEDFIDFSISTPGIQELAFPKTIGVGVANVNEDIAFGGVENP